MCLTCFTSHLPSHLPYLHSYLKNNCSPTRPVLAEKHFKTPVQEIADRMGQKKRMNFFQYCFHVFRLVQKVLTCTFLQLFSVLFNFIDTKEDKMAAGWTISVFLTLIGMLGDSFPLHCHDTKSLEMCGYGCIW